jgi:hypothetical membrane protein
MTVIYFVVQPVVAAVWDPPYSYTASTISALGNTTSPRHLLMNVVFVAVGVLMVAGAYFLRDYWPRRRLTTWGLAFVGLSGLGAVLVGLAPSDVNLAVHGTGALLQLPGAIGPLLLGLATISQRRVERVFSIGMGLLGTLASILFFANVTLGLGRGAMERLGFDPLTVWMIVIGVVVLTKRAKK